MRAFLLIIGFICAMVGVVILLGSLVFYDLSGTSLNVVLFLTGGGTVLTIFLGKLGNNNKDK